MQSLPVKSKARQAHWGEVGWVVWLLIVVPAQIVRLVEPRSDGQREPILFETSWEPVCKPLGSKGVLNRQSPAWSFGEWEWEWEWECWTKVAPTVELEERTSRPVASLVAAALRIQNLSQFPFIEIQFRHEKNS